MLSYAIAPRSEALCFGFGSEPVRLGIGPSPGSVVDRYVAGPGISRDGLPLLGYSVLGWIPMGVRPRLLFRVVKWVTTHY